MSDEKIGYWQQTARYQLHPKDPTLYRYDLNVG